MAGKKKTSLIIKKAPDRSVSHDYQHRYDGKRADHKTQLLESFYWIKK